MFLNTNMFYDSKILYHLHLQNLNPVTAEEKGKIIMLFSLYFILNAKKRFFSQNDVFFIT